MPLVSVVVVLVMVGFGTSWLLTRPLMRFLLRRGIMDVPGPRSSHLHPTPRGGGLAIVLGIMAATGAGWAMGLPTPGIVFMTAVLAMALVGSLDDWLGELSPVVRLALHVTIAAGYVGFSGGFERLPLPAPASIEVGWLGFPLAVIWIVGVTNLYNFLDGIDGFAVIQGSIAGLVLAVLGGMSPATAVGLGATGACFGFMYYNWHPARVFMGDVGSVTLGFLFAALPFELESIPTHVSVFVVAMTLWFFLSDGAFTILRRVLKREEIWRAHRSHLYQRLVKAGLGHGEVAKGVGSAQFALAAITLAIVLAYPEQALLHWGIAALAIGSFVGYVRITDTYERRKEDNDARGVTPAYSYPNTGEFVPARLRSSGQAEGWGPWPYFAADEIDAAKAVLASGGVNYFTGNEGRNFEEEFAAFVGTKHAIAVMNGTIALELALRAIGIKEGDDVVVPSRTFVATASSVITVGGRPVFADVDRETGNITAASIEAALTPNTRAIICVHLAGLPCDMDPIMALAQRRNLRVIEDCAQSLGADYRGRQTGSFGDIAAFSFCQDKIMTTAGEGGMVVTDNTPMWAAMWGYKDHGKDIYLLPKANEKPGFAWLVESFGTNGRMTEIQAAIGRIALRKVPRWIDARRSNAAYFDRRFSDVRALHVPRYAPETRHAFYKYYVFVRTEALKAGWDRDRILVEVKRRGVPCYSGICSEIYLENAFKKAGIGPAERLPVARDLGERSLMFPVHPTLSESDLARIADAVEAVLAESTLASVAA